jgi:SAM-dependent MidA family methyltransferase
MAAQLIKRIRAEALVTFDVFMEMALYDMNAGYFKKEQLRSVESGDFLTSPEVSPLFGETLATFVRREGIQGCSSLPLVVDAGAGSGSLLRHLDAVVGKSVDLWAVEVSPPARRASAEVVGRHRVAHGLDGLPFHIQGVIFANELLDNLPMAVARLARGGWREMLVGEESGQLMWVDGPVRPEVREWLRRFSGPVPVGGLVEVQMQACQWITDVLARLEEGALVVIDYGDTAEGLEDRRAEGTLRTYRNHHLGPDPLAEPGETDITADVNFTALMKTAEEAGATVSLLRQDGFLEGLGLRDRINKLRRQELEFARAGDEGRRLEVRSLRTGAETLLHPRGLGAFQVLIARKSI